MSVTCQPACVRSDNDPEFIAEAVRDSIKAVGGQSGLHRAWISMGEWILRKLQRANAPFSADCFAIACRTVNGLLDRKTFYSLCEAQIIIDNWRSRFRPKMHYGVMGGRPSEPEATVPKDQRSAMRQFLSWTTQVGPLTLTTKQQWSAAHTRFMAVSASTSNVVVVLLRDQADSRRH